MSKGFFQPGHVPVRRYIHLNGLTGATEVEQHFTLPANYEMKRIYIHNLTENAITGGIDLGVTDEGQEYLAALAVGADALISAPLVATGLSEADDVLYFAPVTAWNGAIIDVVIECVEVPAP